MMKFYIVKVNTDLAIARGWKRSDPALTKVLELAKLFRYKQGAEKFIRNNQPRLRRWQIVPVFVTVTEV